MDSSPRENEVLDGYRLIRLLGRGGFGEVWLCRAEAVGDDRAMKILQASRPELLEKELDALVRYRRVAAATRCLNLVSIEHINRSNTALHYVMPLADGRDAALSPEDPAWEPDTLAARIRDRAGAGAWFSGEEIVAMFAPVLRALDALAGMKLVHRDVKPENILMVRGEPCLADISLLGADSADITRRGTPGYATPSWYEDGQPDMYGAAATLYSLLTGNAPDKMGRAAFLWPPQGEASLAPAERAAWMKLHQVIRRATHEKVSERYQDFQRMEDALRAAVHPGTAVAGGRKPRWLIPTAAAVAVLAVGAVAAVALRDDPAPVAENTITGGSTDTAPQGGHDTPQPKGKYNLTFRDGYLIMEAVQEVGDLEAPEPKSLDEEYVPIVSDSQRSLVNSLSNEINTEVNRPASGEGPTDANVILTALNQLSTAVPPSNKVTNIRLSRLLAEKHLGKEVTFTPALEEEAVTRPLPSHSIFGAMSNRADLLRALGRLDLADRFLTERLGEEKRDSMRTLLLCKRAEIRAWMGRHADAKKDGEEAMKLTGDDGAEKINILRKLKEISKEVPDFAAHLPSVDG